MPGAGAVGTEDTSSGFGREPGNWKKGRKSSGRTLGLTSSGRMGEGVGPASGGAFCPGDP
jgi:hypothetical protein